MISDGDLHKIVERLSGQNGGRAVCVTPYSGGTYRAVIRGGRQYLIGAEGDVLETVPDHSDRDWDPAEAEEARELAATLGGLLTERQVAALVLGFPYPLPYRPGEGDRLARAILAYEALPDALARARYYAGEER